jgi:hypothetical protein
VSNSFFSSIYSADGTFSVMFDGGALMRVASGLLFGLLCGASFASSDCQPQCTTFVANKIGLQTYSHAKSWWSNIPQGYERISNGTGIAPTAGDIVVWQMQPHGHVAIITSVTSTTVTVEEANWSGDCRYGNRTLDRKGNYLNGPNASNMPPIGWLTRVRAKPTPPQYVSSTPSVGNRPNSNSYSQQPQTWATGNANQGSSQYYAQTPEPLNSRSNQQTWNTVSPSRATPQPSQAQQFGYGYSNQSQSWNTTSPYANSTQQTYQAPKQCRWINNSFVCK